MGTCKLAEEGLQPLLELLMLSSEEGKDAIQLFLHRPPEHLMRHLVDAVEMDPAYYKDFLLKGGYTPNSTETTYVRMGQDRKCLFQAKWTQACGQVEHYYQLAVKMSACACIHSDSTASQMMLGHLLA